mgnify:CR=1 FL=1
MLTKSQIKIAIGSLRKPKVEAVKSAIQQIARTIEPSFARVEYLPCEVDSGIANTPASIADMMRGAQNRAQHLLRNLSENNSPADFYLGLEGGIFHVLQKNGGKTFFLQSWVFVNDGRQGAFGSSPAVKLPNVIATALGGGDFELADLIDRIGKLQNNRDKGGAFAFLTKGLLTRQAIFESAVLAAMAPFYHPQVYDQ